MHKAAQILTNNFVSHDAASYAAPTIFASHQKAMGWECDFHVEHLGMKAAEYSSHFLWVGYSLHWYSKAEAVVSEMSAAVDLVWAGQLHWECSGSKTRECEQALDAKYSPKKPHVVRASAERCQKCGKAERTDEVRR